MEHSEPPYDVKELEAMNEKAIQNQFFTPDLSYIDLSLLKDIPLGVIYADTLSNNPTADEFKIIQDKVLKIVEDYQIRTYDTVDTHLGPMGYDDKKIESLLNSTLQHDVIFAVAPTTSFFSMLIRHTIRNRNNSRPAEKFVKTKIDKDQYILKPIDITYLINTYPLTLSPKLLATLSVELGESFGVNIQFMNKDIALFDEKDWNEWIKNVDCFYLNSLGIFTRNPHLYRRQGEMDFVGRFFFARKRFEKHIRDQMIGVDFEQQIQMATAHLDMLCDFSWIQNNDTRLTKESKDIRVDIFDTSDAVMEPLP